MNTLLKGQLKFWNFIKRWVCEEELLFAFFQFQEKQKPKFSAPFSFITLHFNSLELQVIKLTP